ncbi:hypothetical protein DSO57_1002849 [Entomophthora muscae]|uniref:Uncharacterized protein n=1 Tax=Entomophthora muscae TaxID=34485 RepID=A0ACC2RZT9_9FUNG|nr:hypothetical protein DSO57_1002849 [Entomophthora muscae]
MTDITAVSSEKLTKKQKKTLKFKEAKKNKSEPKETSSIDVPEEADFTLIYEGVAPQKDAVSNKRKIDAPAASKKVQNNTKPQEPLKSEPQPKKVKKEKASTENKYVSRTGVSKYKLMGKKPGAKNARYIVFIGNLPFNCTVEEIKQHLKSCGGEISIRLITDKETNKSKGYAFAEFESSVSLSKALHLHNAMFKGRKLNVEVTAGGGGSSVNRKQKLSERNEKLSKERALFAEKRKDPKNKRAPANDSVGAIDPSMNPERAKMLSSKSKSRAS